MGARVHQTALLSYLAALALVLVVVAKDNSKIELTATGPTTSGPNPLFGYTTTTNLDEVQSGGQQTAQTVGFTSRIAELETEVNRLQNSIDDIELKNKAQDQAAETLKSETEAATGSIDRKIKEVGDPLSDRMTADKANIETSIARIEGKLFEDPWSEIRRIELKIDTAETGMEQGIAANMHSVTEQLRTSEAKMSAENQDFIHNIQTYTRSFDETEADITEAKRHIIESKEQGEKYLDTALTELKNLIKTEINDQIGILRTQNKNMQAAHTDAINSIRLQLNGLATQYKFFEDIAPYIKLHEKWVTDHEFVDQSGQGAGYSRGTSSSGNELNEQFDAAKKVLDMKMGQPTEIRKEMRTSETEDTLVEHS